MPLVLQTPNMDALTQAREQLEGITFAINREKLILETSQKDNEIAIKAIADQSAKLDDLNKQIETAEFALKATNEQIEDAKKAFAEETDTLNLLKSGIASHEEVRKTNLATIQAEVDKIKAGGEQAKNVVKDELAKLETDKAIAQSAVNVAVNKVSDLNEEADKIQEGIKTLTDDIVEKQHDFDELDEKLKNKQNELDAVIIDVTKETDNWNGIKKDIVALEKSKIESAGALAAVNADLEKQKTERDAFVAAKFALAKATQDLANREAFIREKYNQAGLPF